MLIICMNPVAVPLLPGLSGIGDPFSPRTTTVTPQARRAIAHAIRSRAPAFYRSAAALTGLALELHETRTGDHTCACPLPSHPRADAMTLRPLTAEERRLRISRALRETRRAPLEASSLPRGRPFRIHHGDSGAGWRCSVCGSGSPIQFLSRLFFLPSTHADAAAWNLAARMLGIDPAAVDARDWLPWDADTAHFEWGKALTYTRSELSSLRPLYQAQFPAWRETEILQFPATGRGTYLVAYRVRGRLTQLEEVAFDGAAARGVPGRRVRFHHWSAARPTSLARSVTGVFPDTARPPKDADGANVLAAAPVPGTTGAGPRVRTVHVVQGAEQAASARLLLGPDVIGPPFGPLGLGQADVDALARFDRIYVWADQTPSGRGFQNQMVRLLRACGLDARAVRWSDWGTVPRGYNLNRLVRDQGSAQVRADGTLHVLIPERVYDQMTLKLG